MEPLIRKSERQRQPTKQSCSLNYDKENEINIAIYLTEFNEYNNKQIDNPIIYQQAIKHLDRHL